MDSGLRNGILAIVCVAYLMASALINGVLATVIGGAILALSVWLSLRGVRWYQGCRSFDLYEGEPQNKTAPLYFSPNSTRQITVNVESRYDAFEFWNCKLRFEQDRLPDVRYAVSVEDKIKIRSAKLIPRGGEIVAPQEMGRDRAGGVVINLTQRPARVLVDMQVRVQMEVETAEEWSGQLMFEIRGKRKRVRGYTDVHVRDDVDPAMLSGAPTSRFSRESGAS